MRQNDQGSMSNASKMKGLVAILLLSNEGIDNYPSILNQVQALQQQQTSTLNQKQSNSLFQRQSIAEKLKQRTDENTLSLAQSLESSEEFTTQSVREKFRASAVTQESLDAAETVMTDEATKEGVRSTTGESTDTLETNLEATDSNSLSQTGTQEANLLKSLSSTEEGSLENTLEGSEDQTQYKSAVDTTLDEIRKLRIIDKELAVDEVSEKNQVKKNSIDEKGIEESILKKIKKDKHGKGRIETLVQEQIEDQADEIEASQTLQQSQEALEYGVMVDTAAEETESQDSSISELEAAAARERKKSTEMKVIAKELKKQDVSDVEIDNSNQSHVQSQAALDDINPTQVARERKVSREPLMPSPESSAVDLGEEFAFKAVKPKKVPKKSEKELIADVVKKSLDLKHKDSKALEEAQSLFKSKSQKKEVNTTKNKEAKKEKHAKQIKHDKPKVLTKQKTEEEIDRENGQLDNLFLTLRESIVENINEQHMTNKTIEVKKKSHGKKKHHHKKDKKAPQAAKLLMIESDVQIDANSNQGAKLNNELKSGVKVQQKLKQKSHAKSKDDEMSPDEMADVELTAMAHSAIGQQKKDEAALNKAKNPMADLLADEDSGSVQTQITNVESTTPTEENQSSEQTSVPAASSDEASTNQNTQSSDKSAQAEQTELLTGVPAHSDESVALERQKKIEEAAEKREKEISGTASTQNTHSDSNANPGGEVAAEQHFEDSSLKTAIGDITTEECLQNVEYKEPKKVEHQQDEPDSLGGDDFQQDQEIHQAIDKIQIDQNVKYLEDVAQPHVEHKQTEVLDDGFLPTEALKATKMFIDEHEMEGTLQKIEGSGSSDQEHEHFVDHNENHESVDLGNLQMKNLMDDVSSAADDSKKDCTLTQTSSEVHQGPPRSVSLLQVESQVDSGAESQSQAQAMIQLRAKATSQAQAAVEALSALGISQKAEVQTHDQNLINALKRTIGQLEAKKNPGQSAAAAKKKAVNNIQKSLTNKILSRLDDSQPLINVFSKMQSLSKMMPQIQDFERRLNILHQVEPILENAIGTLSKVVDLNSAIPAAPTPKPKPKAKAAAPASPDINQLKALLANAQTQAAPEPAPEEDTSDALAGLLGGAGGDLEGLLGGAAEEPAAEAPAAPEPEPAADDALAGLLGGAGGGGDTSALLSQLLGSSLVQTDQEINMKNASE